MLAPSHPRWASALARISDALVGEPCDGGDPKHVREKDTQYPRPIGVYCGSHAEARPETREPIATADRATCPEAKRSRARESDSIGISRYAAHPRAW